MLWAILIGVAVFLVVFIGVVAMRPAAYRVERAAAITAPADVVFGVLNDLHQFIGVLVLFGSPLGKNDPGMQKTFEGPASGVGQTFTWSGKEAGAGKLTIEESVAGQKVRMKLEFVKPMKSIATIVLALTGAPSGSSVTWSMAGNHNFIGKAFGVFMNMDNMLGADLEKGLAELKTVAESTRVATPAAGARG